MGEGLRTMRRIRSAVIWSKIARSEILVRYNIWLICKASSARVTKAMVLLWSSCTSNYVSDFMCNTGLGLQRPAVTAWSFHHFRRGTRSYFACLSVCQYRAD